MPKIKVEEYFNVKWIAGMPQDIFIRLQKASSQDIEFIDIEQQLFDKWQFDVAEFKVLNARINNCANWNNQGIAKEKSGETSEAIRFYELNIADGYPATHAYNRLIKIYRRLRRYDDEFRVIDFALQFFTNSNSQQFEQACKKPENENYLNNLQIAHETCTSLKNHEGRSIYSPYPIFLYIERIARCEELKAKQQINKGI